MWQSTRMNLSAFLRNFLALFSLVLIEAFCYSYGEDYVGKRLNSWLYLLSGLGIGVVCMHKVDRSSLAGPSWLKWGMLTAFLVLMVYFVPDALFWMDKVPVDYKIADMLPIMEVMCQRFMGGSNVYLPIMEIWDGMLPIYLPTMWLPYIPAVIWGFDLRWITWFFFAGSILLVALPTPRGRALSWYSLSVWIPTAMLFYAFLHKSSNDFSMADEGPVVGFYILLAWAIWQGNAWFIGICMALSVLTRYSLAPWILVFGLWVLLFQKRAAAFQMAGISLALSLFLMYITGAIYELQTFIGLPKHYMEAIFKPEDYWKLEPTIKNSLGMAKFFARNDLPQLTHLQIGFTFGVPLACVGLYWRYRERFDPLLFGLATFKLSLVVFFNMLIIPLHNLFITSNFLTLALLFFYVQKRNLPLLQYLRTTS